MDFIDLWYYFEILKMCYLNLYYLGIAREFYWQEMILKNWELCQMLGYDKVLWNYLEMNYEFQFI